MDVTKKRRMDGSGVFSPDSEYSSPNLTPDDARKLIERFTPDQLIGILQVAVSRHFDVLAAVRSLADPDIAQRKIFVRGLGCDTTTEGLRGLFSAYGELAEAIVVLDKTTGKSKGYGFVTFKHVDGALLALKEPSKTIDGRVTVSQLAVAGNSGANSNPADLSLRKIYVANVPVDMPAHKLLSHFSFYGEIEEGPLGFDKQTGKCRGYALFVYKKPEGAQAALVDPNKTIEGHQVNCKLANDVKKGKPEGVYAQVGAPGNLHANGIGSALTPSVPGQVAGQYGGGIGPFGGFSGGIHGQQSLVSSFVGPGMSSVSSQAGASLGGGMAGAYASGYGAPSGYGGLNGGGSLGGSGAAPHRLPATTAGMVSGGYSESGQFGISSSSAYQSQHHPAPGTSSIPWIPPPYY